jgi:hypothetical protein
MLLLDVKEIDSQADPAVGAVCIAVPVRTGPENAHRALLTLAVELADLRGATDPAVDKSSGCGDP